MAHMKDYTVLHKILYEILTITTMERGLQLLSGNLGPTSVLVLLGKNQLTYLSHNFLVQNTTCPTFLMGSYKREMRGRRKGKRH